MDMPTPKELLAKIKDVDQEHYNLIATSARECLISQWQGDHNGVRASIPTLTKDRVIKRFVEDMRHKGWCVKEESAQREGRWLIITPFELGGR